MCICFEKLLCDILHNVMYVQWYMLRFFVKVGKGTAYRYLH